MSMLFCAVTPSALENRYKYLGGEYGVYQSMITIHIIRHTDYIFATEDGCSMFQRNVGNLSVSQRGVKTRETNTDMLSAV
jgi:hypothetical protein